jgi:hypothetical protein
LVDVDGLDSERWIVGIGNETWKPTPTPKKNWRSVLEMETNRKLAPSLQSNLM